MMTSSLGNPDHLDTDEDSLISKEDIHARVGSQRIFGQHPCLLDDCSGQMTLLPMDPKQFKCLLVTSVEQPSMSAQTEECQP